MSATPFPFKINSKYNFTTKAPALLGSNYKNMKVEAILGADDATRLYGDVQTTFERVGGVTTLPKNIYDLHFVVFKTGDGDKKIFAYEYLENIVEIQGVSITFTVVDVDSTAQTNIINALNDLGYINHSFTITTTNV